MSFSPSALWPKTTLRLKFTLAAHLLTFSDSRFTVLASSLAVLPQTHTKKYGVIGRSVKPLWWSNTQEKVISHGVYPVSGGAV